MEETVPVLRRSTRNRSRVNYRDIRTRSVPGASSSTKSTDEAKITNKAKGKSTGRGRGRRIQSDSEDEEEAESESSSEEEEENDNMEHLKNLEDPAVHFYFAGSTESMNPLATRGYTTAEISNAIEMHKKLEQPTAVQVDAAKGNMPNLASFSLYPMTGDMQKPIFTSVLPLGWNIEKKHGAPFVLHSTLIGVPADAMPRFSVDPNNDDVCDIETASEYEGIKNAATVLRYSWSQANQFIISFNERLVKAGYRPARWCVNYSGLNELWRIWVSPFMDENKVLSHDYSRGPSANTYDLLFRSMDVEDGRSANPDLFNILPVYDGTMASLECIVEPILFSDFVVCFWRQHVCRMMITGRTDKEAILSGLSLAPDTDLNAYFKTLLEGQPADSVGRDGGSSDTNEPSAKMTGAAKLRANTKATAKSKDNITDTSMQVVDLVDDDEDITTTAASTMNKSKSKTMSSNKCSRSDRKGLRRVRRRLSSDADEDSGEEWTPPVHKRKFSATKARKKKKMKKTKKSKKSKKTSHGAGAASLDSDCYARFYKTCMAINSRGIKDSSDDDDDTHAQSPKKKKKRLKKTKKTKSRTKGRSRRVTLSNSDSDTAAGSGDKNHLRRTMPVISDRLMLACNGVTKAHAFANSSNQKMYDAFSELVDTIEDGEIDMPGSVANSINKALQNAKTLFDENKTNIMKLKMHVLALKNAVKEADKV